MSNKLKKITSMQLFLPIFCMILVTVSYTHLRGRTRVDLKLFYDFY